MSPPHDINIYIPCLHILHLSNYDINKVSKHLTS